MQLAVNKSKVTYYFSTSVRFVALFLQFETLSLHQFANEELFFIFDKGFSPSYGHSNLEQ
mgnify:FL=1